MNFLWPVRCFPKRLSHYKCTANYSLRDKEVGMTKYLGCFAGQMGCADRISSDVTPLNAVRKLLPKCSSRPLQREAPPDKRFGLPTVSDAIQIMAGRCPGGYLHNHPLAYQFGLDRKLHMQKATFAAGCFWGVEATFRKVDGVASTAVGYLGGDLKNPTYEDVCAGSSGHAEVVEVTFDADMVSYDTLLDIFWRCHNPTTLNRQGPDVGTQYRSAIFFHNSDQKTKAEASIDALTKADVFPMPIVTEITPTSTFYMAEDYHQQYLEKRGAASCRLP